MTNQTDNPAAEIYDLQKQPTQHHIIVRFFAHLFSYIFHPLFIPLYVTYYLAFIHPGYFTGINPQQKMLVVLRVGYNMVFFPAITVLLLKGVGFINSIFLKTQRERMLGYVTAQIFFFWMYL